MLNQAKCPRTQQLEGKAGETEREREKERERARERECVHDGILMGTPAVCRLCRHPCVDNNLYN